MKIKGNGWSALILAAGLWVCFAEPPQAVAATDTAGASSTAGAPIALNKYTRHGSHHGRKYAHHKSGKVALKSTDDKNDKNDKKAAATEVAADDSGKSPTPPTSSEIPSSVANANAQLATSDSPTGDAAQAMSVRAGNIVQSAANDPAATQPAAEDQVVAPDQLNDVDRALHQGNAPVAPFAVASAEPPTASAAASVVADSAAGSSSDSTWEQTSLIGKIFIGFGALLTMASAARMFMA
jgi:hypothetical protein